MCRSAADQAQTETAQRVREIAFDRVADRYAEDARSDFRRAAVYSVAASVAEGSGAIWGALSIRSGDGALSQGLVIAALFTAGSLPFWWQADRFRRSALENRRMHRHVLTVEPYLSGFEGLAATTARASLAQRLFARTAEDDNPISEPSWPSGAELVSVKAELGTSPPDPPP